TLWAARIRSPSFSRSSSSTTITGLPARSSASSSSTLASALLCSGMFYLPQGREALGVLREDVALEVDPRSGAQLTEGRHLQRVRYQPQAEVVGRPLRLGSGRPADVDQRQADAVHRDAAL